MEQYHEEDNDDNEAEEEHDEEARTNDENDTIRGGNWVRPVPSYADAQISLLSCLRGFCF